MIKEGLYFRQELYSFRGLSKALPLNPQGDADSKAIYSKKIKSVLFPSVSLMVDLMAFSAKCSKTFKDIYSSYLSLEATKKDGLILCEKFLMVLCTFFSLILEIDCLKDFKAGFGNDLSLYKRCVQDMHDPIIKLVSTLSPFLANKNQILNDLASKLKDINNYSIIEITVNFALHQLEKGRYIIPDRKYTYLKVF